MTGRIIRSEDQLDRMPYGAYVGNRRRIGAVPDAVLRRLPAQRRFAPEQERLARTRLAGPPDELRPEQRPALEKEAMTDHRDEPDPMTGQSFSGISGSPTARMPDPPPRPGEGGDRNQLVGLAGSILLLILLVVIVIMV